MILKPILVVITFILYAKGKYADGNFSVNQSYLYITIIYTISYSMALYALALFYAACRDLLRPFNPVPKFIIIKSVVFLTYWQVSITTTNIFIPSFKYIRQPPGFVSVINVAIGSIHAIIQGTFFSFGRVSWFSLLPNLDSSRTLKRLLISRTLYCVLRCS